MEDVFDDIINPPQQTQAEIKAIAASNVKQMTVSFASSAIAQRNEGFAHIWDAAKLYGLTPQQVCDALGTSAASIFHRDGSFCQWVVDNIPQLASMLRLPPPDATITYETDGEGNETGHVTITMPE